MSYHIDMLCLGYERVVCGINFDRTQYRGTKASLSSCFHDIEFDQKKLQSWLWLQDEKKWQFLLAFFFHQVFIAIIAPSSDRTQYRGKKASLYGQAVIYLDFDSVFPLSTMSYHHFQTLLTTIYQI